MAGFADLVDAPGGGGFHALIDPPAPRRQSAPDSSPPVFQTNDPASMRASLAASNYPQKDELLAAFDHQFPQVQSTPTAGAGRGMMPASEYQQPSPAPAAQTQPPSNAPNPTGDAPNPLSLAAHIATGFGSTVAGGYRGLATLLTGGGLDKAVQNINDTQQKYTYNAPAGSVDSQMEHDFASNYNPLNWPAAAGSYVGGKVADAGYPMAGAAITGAGAVAPMLLGMDGVKAPIRSLLKGPEPIAPRIEPTMGAPEPPATTNPIQLPAAAPAAAKSATPEQAFADQPAPNGAKVLPAAEQARRAQVLQSVGLDNARKSAIAGDGASAATDAQTAKLDSPAGNVMRAQLDTEKSTLENYADKMVQNTGGTTLADQAADYTRGTNITTALDGIKGWFDKNTSRMYGVADERAQGVPTGLDSFRTVLGDDSMLTNSDRVHLRNAINSYAQKLGMVGEDGTVFANAQQAETMRKFLNENWSPSTSKYIGAMKDGMTDDITKAAGEDIYSEARQMRALRGATLDNPDGIAQIMDSSGPNSINRAVAIEKIPQKIASMPVNQLGHVVDTLRNAPDEVQPQAQVALSEIKSHFANQVRNIGKAQAGQYNAKGVGDFLRSNAARMTKIFTPNEMSDFKTLHDAGQILAKDQSYPGAAAQNHNLLRAGAMAAVQGGASLAGSALGGPVVGAVGGFIGGKVAQAIGEKASLRSVRGRMTKLSDLPGIKPD